MSVKVMKGKTLMPEQEQSKTAINFAATIEAFADAQRFLGVLSTIGDRPQLTDTEKFAIEDAQTYFNIAISNAVAVSDAFGMSVAQRMESIKSQSFSRLRSVVPDIAMSVAMNCVGALYSGGIPQKDGSTKKAKFTESLRDAFDAYIDSIKGQVKGMVGTMDGKFSYDGFTYNGQNIRLNSGILYIERLNNIGIVFDTVQAAEAFYEANKFPGCWLEQITDFHTSLKQIG